MIYALRPESFCALKVAIGKVQTFWASDYMCVVSCSMMKDDVEVPRTEKFLHSFCVYFGERVLFILLSLCLRWNVQLENPSAKI